MVLRTSPPLRDTSDPGQANPGRAGRRSGGRPAPERIVVHVTARQPPTTPGELAHALTATGYLADEGLATAGYLALRLRRPLFLEGEAGVGKTAFAGGSARAPGRISGVLQGFGGLEAGKAR